MKRSLALFILGIALSAVVSAGHASTNQLLVPAGITRPLKADPPPRRLFSNGISIVNFSFEPPEKPMVIGRDSDQAREIVWGGDPGRLLADLVAGALSEHGVRVSRLKEGDPVPRDVSTAVKGIVRRFEANIYRQGINDASVEATVEITLFVAPWGEHAPWSTSISGNAVIREAVPLPEDVRKALSSAANSVADEAARRLR